MADSNRIVFPDEVEEAKAAAGKPADKSTGGDSNSLEEVTEVPPTVTVMTRNMITVPPNCPPGFKMGPDGVCREVFD